MLPLAANPPTLRRVDVVMSFRLHRCVASAVVLFMLGCSDPAGDAVAPAPTQGSTSVVLGVTSDVAVVESMSMLELVVESPPGEIVSREELEPGGGALFPFERAFQLVAPGTPVVATFTPMSSAGEPLFQRRVATSAVADRTLLLRVRLNAECMASDDWPRGASCIGTCVAGLCEDPYKAPSTLEDYDPSWSRPSTDPCIESGTSEPQIKIGHPDPPFTPLEPGTVLIPERGAQGGTHIWLSVRMWNLQQKGTVTAATEDVLATGTLGSVQKFSLAYEAGAEGCDLYHLRYVLPTFGSWEQDVRLGVTLVDTTGMCAREHVEVYVASPPP